MLPERLNDGQRNDSRKQRARGGMTMTKTVGLRGMVSMAAGLSAVLGAGAFVAAAPPCRPQQPTVVVSFDPALTQLPESMTSDNDGNLFASNFSGAIQK